MEETGAHSPSRGAASPRTAVAFISYATSDNAVPDHRPGAAGFVAHFQRQLLYELETELGLEGLVLWRDRTEIEPGDKWSEEIIKALHTADILVVVLSRAYAKREWCSLELETFAGRQKTAVVSDRHGRILRVDKQALEASEIPDILRPIQAVRFFEYDRLNREDRPFFWRGLVRDERFYEAVRALAMAIERAIKRLPPSPVPNELREPPPPELMAAPPNGRTVFVAKTAHELRDAYRGVVAELKGRGYRVVPPEEAELPGAKDDAEREIVRALGEAELAVHLIGRHPGHVPHGADRGIVPLQLALSGARAGQKGFARIIWAPKVIDTLVENDGGGDAQAGVDERDPLERLARMDAALLPEDQVDGGPFAGFRELLVRELDARGRSQPEDVGLQAAPSATRVYLLHHENDRRFAVNVAKKLKDRGLAVKLPSIDGEPQEQLTLHRQRLAECDVVLLCWRDGSGTWMEIAAGELRDFRKLERDGAFLCRAVLLGGELTAAKRDYLDVYSPEEIDRVFDGTESRLDAAISEIVSLLGHEA